MKTFRSRVVAGLLAVALLVPGVAAAVAPFTDVVPGKFYESAANWARDNGITTGSPAGSSTFKPNDPVTRGESVTFLKRYNDNVVKQTVGQLSCSSGQVASFIGGGWGCANDRTIPDTNTDALGALACTTDQIAHYDGSAWACSTEQLSYRAVPGTVSVVDTAGTVGGYSSIAIGVDGFPIVSYYDTTNTNLKIVHCTDRQCATHDAPVTLDASASVGRDTSLAIGSDGFPVVSYYDATNTALKAVHCSNVACSTHDTPSTLDNSGNVGLGSSLAIGTDNLPIVSYKGGASNDLVVVRCGTKTCASADAPIAQSVGDFVNGDTAMTIGSDGFPVITYWNAAGPIKVVHCTDSTCSTRDPVATVDSANASLQGPEIAVGVDGFPILSYWDSANIDLKSVHCTSRACNTHDIPVVVESIGDVGSGSSIAIGVDGLPRHRLPRQCDWQDVGTALQQLGLHHS